MSAIRDAENATRAAANALSRALNGAKEMVSTAQRISGKSVPIAFSGADLAKRLGMRVASVMGSIEGHHQKLGNQEWLAGHMKSTDLWSESENDYVTRHIFPLVTD